MAKILLTGDIHLGRNYHKESPSVSEKYKAARMQALENAIDIANRESCDFFVIAGDLYDKPSQIQISLHQRVCQILDSFLGEAVLILPGNHDYYNSTNDTLWHDFEACSSPHIKVFKENKKCCIGNTIFYPCICHDKHSKEHSLSWIFQDTERNPDLYHIGIAHGAVEGTSYDSKQEFYFMKQEELLSCNMDAWLIGHAHTPYPTILDCTANQRIFNAGTPQPADINENMLGEVFVLEINSSKRVKAKKEQTSNLQFVKKDILLQRGQTLQDALQFPDLNPVSTSLRIILSGSVCSTDFEQRNKFYEDLRRHYVKVDIQDNQLRKEISSDMINKEALEGSLINKLLHSYADNLTLLNLAYDLLISCKEEK